MFKTITYHLPYLFLFLGIVGLYMHIKIKGIVPSKQKIEIFLIYTFAFLIGAQGIYAFIGHAFLPAEVALSIGWSPSPHFQFEIACANLSYGVLGILAIRWKGDFWSAIAIGISIFLWGSAFGHLKDIILSHNFAPSNAGYMLFYDIFTPLILFALLKLRSLYKLIH